jgi:glycosyltransferase involved in cell wall biosynthesis
MTRRLLTIGHSYVVAENRRLAHELALAGGPDWAVTAVAPAQFRGDLRRIDLEPLAGERSVLVPLKMRLDRSPHLMWYAGLTPVLARPWDVVHCWEEPYVHATHRVAAHVPSDAAFAVSTFQNIPKQYPWPFSRFERDVMQRADGWIAFGESVHTALKDRDDYRERPGRVIPPGVDVERFAPAPAAGAAVRQTLGWTASDFVVGYLGRFVTQKGISVLLEALRGTRSPWRALFVGGGPMQRDLEVFGAEFPGRVHIATSVPHSDVPRWLNAMSVLCAPSQTTAAWREQFGRMLIEAMACGVPVMASASGEIPHVVGDAGCLLPEADAAAWRSAIDRLADPDARRAMSAAGRDRAVSSFSWPVVARRHLQFFEELL